MFRLNKYPVKINKKVTIELLFMFVFLCMWILFGWNTGNADYDNYHHIYSFISQYGGYSGVEVGFEFVCRIATAIGLNYNGFLVVYSFIGLSLIASTARKYTNNITFMFILYFIYPFLLDIVQIRNFMVMAIIIFAMRYLITNKKKDYIKYVVFVLIASTFHYSALFYVSFLLVRIRNYKKLICVTFTILILGIVLNSVLPGIVYKYLSVVRYESYFSFSTNFYAKILAVVYLGVSITLTYYAYTRIKNDKALAHLHETDNKRDNQIAYSELVMKINIIILVVYVLIIIDIDFIRLFRNILPLNFILFSMTKVKNKISKNANNFIHNLGVITFVTLSSWAFIFFTTFESVVYAIFNNNIILDFFK